jgi:hypothetical protein
MHNGLCLVFDGFVVVGEIGGMGDGGVEIVV